MCRDKQGGKVAPGHHAVQLGQLFVEVEIATCLLEALQTIGGRKTSEWGLGMESWVECEVKLRLKLKVKLEKKKKVKLKGERGAFEVSEGGRRKVELSVRYSWGWSARWS
jgi:hypothetical protein